MTRKRGNIRMALVPSGKIILASKSPRRIELLSQLGLDVEIMPSEIDEMPLRGETPEEHVLRLSEYKADAAARVYPNAFVVSADTIVVIGGEVLGKPQSLVEARAMLGRLSGRMHKVFTGFTIERRIKNILIKDFVESSVLFKEITEDELAWYVNTAEPYDKAGGYAVQGMGAFLIKEIHGSYTNVMGLPLCEIVGALKKVGAISFS
jgi:septum formation protein